ncbi:MAG: hypothetical protein JSU00_09145 [Acidobacteria bacterium]|nr:hypothetical protein [Acidobacteriota bacterium]
MFQTIGKIAPVVVLFAVTTSWMSQAQVCWRQSYTRGVGAIPTDCGPGKEYDAGLCYRRCPAGMKGVGPVCWGTCPAGYTDVGAGCAKPAAYGRGAGYPWKFGDPLSDSAMYARCERDNGRGGCEKDGAIVYPKCRPGFHKVGCCICSPDCPAGLTDTGAICTKQTQGRGVGTVPSSCGGGRDYDAGLCYASCRMGFSGVGPVCWGQCPASAPVNCGAACATSTAACVGAITEQVHSVLDVALNIATTVATAGTGTAAKAAVTTSAKAMARSVAVQAEKSAVRTALEDAARKAGKRLTSQQLDQLQKMSQGEDFDPYSLDPTGIADIVRAYNKPICGN